MAERPIVSITHLSKSYRRGDQIVPVLRDITLAIPEGDFIALNSTTGAVLWRFKGGMYIGSNPVTYSVEGRQYVAAAIGRALFVFDLME